MVTCIIAVVILGIIWITIKSFDDNDDQSGGLLT